MSILKNNKQVLILCVLLFFKIVHGQSETNSNTQNEVNENTEKEKQQNTYKEHMYIIGKTDKMKTESGSSTVIDEEVLETFEFDDIARILLQVPGVNIREEDGYGLRPNIGFRGVTPERSQKINLMEDGVLFSPAPYSAPAAYYFPIVSRMTSVEVFKGPAAILYGPNTVAGSLNLVSRPVSGTGLFDILIGSNDYRRLHTYYGKEYGKFGFLVEFFDISTDGFKELDSIFPNQETGFDKQDITLKSRYDLSGSGFEQIIELKLNYSDEISNETYLGLTDFDFQNDPYRRYTASQLDLIDWTHEQFQFTHFIAKENFDVTTRVYRNNFDRVWRRLNNFNPNPVTGSIALQDILNDPNNVEHFDFYQILIGERNTESPNEELVVTNNDRTFFSQGIQSDIRLNFSQWGLEHRLKAGIRWHQDQVIRLHTEDNFSMQNGVLISTGTETDIATSNREKSTVVSLYVQDTLVWEKLELSFGLRSEFIDAFFQNRLDATDWIDKDTRVILPGASLFYRLNESVGLFAGVHNGFIPTSPQQPAQTEVEESLNYELGLRYKMALLSTEIVGFFHDFSNLSESCTFSTSSNCVFNIDEQFDAGEVDVYGLEFSLQTAFQWNDTLSSPLSFVYTFTDSEFKESFNSDFALWGNVEAGDPVPYLAEHQATINWGLEASQWQLALQASYIGEMHEAAGSGVALSGIETDDLLTVDTSFNFFLSEKQTIYAKIDNLFDEATIVSRRPFGARPNKPRQFFIGYKYRIE